MKKLSFRQLFLLVVVMAVVGAWLYVQFRAWTGNEDTNVLYLVTFGIGVAIAFLADHRRHPRLLVGTAATCAFLSSVGGKLWVAQLERQALATEFNPASLTDDDFFIALEAYQSKYARDAGAPPFTGVAARKYFSDAEWDRAKQKWHGYPADTRDLVRAQWRSSYATVAEMADTQVRTVFVAWWNLFTYAVCAMLAGGIVLVVQRDKRRHRAG